MVAAEKCKRLKEKVQGLFIEAQQYKGITQKQTHSLKKKKEVYFLQAFFRFLEAKNNVMQIMPTTN